jgi:hypothetical protein
MSSPDAIPSRGDAVVALIYLRDTRNPDRNGGQPLIDDFGATGARR